MRVLCVAGSPRRNGNSSRLLDEVVKGVQTAGGSVARIAVADLSIEPCRGCGGCSASGECVVRDGMGDIYALLDSADAIAVATPVYFATVPARLKGLLDRCQPYWVRRHLLGAPAPARKRPGAVLVVGGGGDPFGVACAVTPVASVFGVLGVSLDETLEVVGPDAAGDIDACVDEMRRARGIGESLVRRARG